MIVGTVRETKEHEYRVALTPECAESYAAHGHDVLVERGAGEGTGFADSDYEKAGATLIEGAAGVFEQADMIVKVKEPQPEEFQYLREGLILYTYLHLAAEAEVTRQLLGKGVTAVAYETIETADGALPCLAPMSQIAGRLAVQQGAKYLEKPFGGRGILLGGVPGVRPGKVGILGGGMVGLNAAKIAVGMGADVTVLELDATRLAYLDDIFSGRVTTLYSNRMTIASILRESDLVIGAVLLHGAKAPKLVQRSQLSLMKRGAVVVDVAIDQGGCLETSRPTTHDDPVYLVDGVVHYCVTNMPGAVALTATRALTSTTLPYGLTLADLGFEAACRQKQAIAKGANTYHGRCVYRPVAEAHELEYSDIETLL